LPPVAVKRGPATPCQGLSQLVTPCYQSAPPRHNQATKIPDNGVINKIRIEENMKTNIKIMLWSALVLAAPLQAAAHDKRPEHPHEQRQKIEDMSPEQFRKHLEHGYERASDKQERKELLKRLEKRKSKMSPAHRKVAEQFLAKHK
jgi:hypothetical protein